MIEEIQCPEDLIRVGVGLGMALRDSNVVKDIGKAPELPVIDGTDMSLVTKTWLADNDARNKGDHPVGVVTADRTVVVQNETSLNHAKEQEAIEKSRNYQKPSSNTKYCNTT